MGSLIKPKDRIIHEQCIRHQYIYMHVGNASSIFMLIEQGIPNKPGDENCPDSAVYRGSLELPRAKNYFILFYSL